MKKRILAIAVACLVAVFAFNGAQAADDRGVVSVNEVIGTIMEVEGTGRVTTQSGIVQIAQLESPVRLYDTVETGPASRIHILFVDDTEMTLSENTSLRIDEYVYDEIDTTENKSFYNVLRGAFLYVSGLIAKKPDPQVTINTPTGSIGIRGTEFWGGMIDKEYGVLVNDGIVKVKTDIGEATVNPGEGVTLKNRRLPPSPVKVWKPEKVEKAKMMVRLKNAPAVRQRIVEFAPKQVQLRQRLQQIQKLKQKDGKYMDPGSKGGVGKNVPGKGKSAPVEGTTIGGSESGEPATSGGGSGSGSSGGSHSGSGSSSSSGGGGFGTTLGN